MSVSLVWVRQHGRRGFKKQKRVCIHKNIKLQRKSQTCSLCQDRRDWFMKELGNFWSNMEISTKIEITRKKKRSKKQLPQKLLFIITLSMFSAVPPAGAIYSVTNWMWLFSIQSAMCDGKHFDKSKREVNQTDSVGGLGGRKTDRDRQRMTKSSNY